MLGHGPFSPNVKRKYHFDWITSYPAAAVGSDDVIRVIAETAATVFDASCGFILDPPHFSLPLMLTQQGQQLQGLLDAFKV